MAPGSVAQWESTAKHLLVATLLISSLAECLVIPMGSGDSNSVSQTGGASEQGGSGYPYMYAFTAQCMSTPLEEMPPRLRRLCIALSTISNLSSGDARFSMDDKAMRENGALLDSGVKRQDVDHVFLRFGRSR
ncbi:myosuppressin [Ischnura elegans]|uniref:myosuppressin n=1 Tax=Ischnura elegans TaxID=197161 RepID=UPI001ED8BE75|nr:myosuppressin [Ischnura elegans]